MHVAIIWLREVGRSYLLLLLLIRRCCIEAQLSAELQGQALVRGS